MDIADFKLDPRRLWRGEILPDAPVVFLDLEQASSLPGDLTLPPCPVIGLGDPMHASAPALDAVVEVSSAETILRNVLASPKAAAVTVQLLRLLPGAALEDALTMESMAYALLQGSSEHRRWIAARATPSEGPNAPRQVACAREGPRMTITLDNPQSGNAIDRTMRDALYDAFSLAALDDSIESVSLRATGKAFSLGAELAEFGCTTDPATAHLIRAHTLPARQVIRCAHRLDVHVQGACVGAGLELAAFARRFTASAGAWFQLPELAMGILPGAGGCVSLSRRIGRQRTALMILSGKRISARVALAWGLIDAIIDEPS